MPTDIYHPESWNAFFSMVGGGAAALTGLVFVALSLNLEDMTREATHKYRSINTLAGLSAVFIRCGLVLMPDQNHVAVGTELFLVALVGAVIFVYGFYQAFKYGSQPSKQRLVVGSGLYLAELIGALMLIAGHKLGLYIVGVSLVINVAFMISATWLLVVGVYRRTSAE